MSRNRTPQGSLRKHSLSLAALAVVVLLIVLYHRSSPDTHMGTFFGNAIADWTGVLWKDADRDVPVLNTAKEEYEKLK